MKIKTAKPRGFNLTIHADSADLVNTKDNSRRIEGMIAFIDKESGREMLMGMNANSWGYRLEEGHGTDVRPNGFMHVPAGDEAPSVIVDTASEYDNAGCKGKKQCTVHMTFGAAILPNSLAAGKYSTMVTYTATAKPAPKPTYTDWIQRTAKINPSDICRSGDNNSSCLVDLDPNMIPVKYTGNTSHAQWTSVAKPEDERAMGNWYDYGKKQWANAITVKPEALSKYKNQTKVIDQSDILGFWVYIPRYVYEVMRRDGTDKPVKAQNFDIKFENTETPKKRPLACKTGNGKDYRTECNVSRELPLTGGEVSTWTTHPAFTFGAKELNGIWFAKFEAVVVPGIHIPGILPDERYLNYVDISDDYALAKTIGVNDPNNVGGNLPYDFVPDQNNHHLVRLSSYMVNNNDWGATTYLSASKYGASYNGVHIIYDGRGGLNTGYNYNTDFGQLASTTNNSTGIYDMSGGGGVEYVAASYSDDLNNSDANSYFGSNAAHPPYVNIYNFNNPNDCTFTTCGGQALHETNNGTNNSNGTTSQWNGNWMRFVDSSNPWFLRGDQYDYSYSGPFSASSDNGSPSQQFTFRVVLAPAPHD